jgi:hypothetical protein
VSGALVVRFGKVDTDELGMVVVADLEPAGPTGADDLERQVIAEEVAREAQGDGGRGP